MEWSAFWGLADFAKLVELFDRHGVSFVSITQAFNTTTSMGRLTAQLVTDALVMAIWRRG
jgi:DNA invertase Pin-like site-specific DNA recombinase